MSGGDSPFGYSTTFLARFCIYFFLIAGRTSREKIRYILCLIYSLSLSKDTIQRRTLITARATSEKLSGLTLLSSALRPPPPPPPPPPRHPRHPLAQPRLRAVGSARLPQDCICLNSACRCAGTSPEGGAAAGGVAAPPPCCCCCKNSCATQGRTQGRHGAVEIGPCRPLSPAGCPPPQAARARP
jgi:hypothetical protein